MIYRITIVCTDDQIRAILGSRGIVTEYRDTVSYDGERAFHFRQWQAWNPFRMEWLPMDQVFRQAIRQATEELQLERLNVMSLENFFK